MRWAHQVSSIGFELVIPIAGGAWLDLEYQTKPWLTILGVILGSFLGFHGLKRLIRELDKSKVGKTASDSQTQSDPPETKLNDQDQAN